MFLIPVPSIFIVIRLNPEICASAHPPGYLFCNHWRKGHVEQGGDSFFYELPAVPAEGLFIPFFRIEYGAAFVIVIFIIHVTYVTKSHVTFIVVAKQVVKCKSGFTMQF